MGHKKKKSCCSISHRRHLGSNFSKTINNETNQTQCSLKPVIIDMASRLQKPFIGHCSEKEIVEYDFRPRRIFVNGLCLVCMDFRQPDICCDSCKMVSYCSIKHMEENRAEHVTLCKVLAQFCRRQDGLSSLAQNLSAEQYRVLRIKLIESLEANLGRRLDLWEKEIVLYPRVCRKCLVFCNACCPECGVDSYCNNEKHQREHARWCLDFRIFRRILQLQREYGNAKPEVPNRLSETPYELPDNLDAVIKDLFEVSKYYEDMDCCTYATISYLSSIPLSTLYTLQKISTDNNAWRVRKNLTVHIVGAEFEFECSNLRFWEKMFLHFLPAMKSLHLVFVGPELQAPPVLFEVLSSIHLCSRCHAKKRSINISFHPGQLYHEISKATDFVRPDIVCLFNPGLYRHTGFGEINTWPQTIREFCKLEVPVVVTAYTEHEIPRDIARIESICEIEVLLQPQRNAFASLKPDRNFVSDDEVPLIYKNYYIGVVKGKCIK